MENLVTEEKLCIPFSIASKQLLPKWTKQAVFKDRNTEKKTINKKASDTSLPLYQRFLEP